MLRHWLHDLVRALLRPIAVLRKVDRTDLRPDLIAGLTCSVVMLPQAMAYATVAELPISVGLFAVKGLWLTVLLYALFAVMALVGWRTWHRMATDGARR